MKIDSSRLLYYIFFIIIFVFIQIIYAQNQRSGYLGNSKRVRIIIDQSYENCKPEEINLPIEDLATKLLKCVKIDAAMPGRSDYDTTLRIKISGKAEGSYYYPAGYLYTGAYLSGKISFEVNKASIYEKKFNAYINTPSITNVTWSPLHPCDAPFNRAFYLSDSVVSKLIEIIYDSYGIDPLINALKDKNADMQNMIIESLNNIGKPAVEPLITAMYNEDPDIIKGSIDALGKIGDKSAVEDLIFMLKGKDSIIRWKAAKALGRLGDKRAVEPLIEALKDENKIVRWYAAKSLGDIGDERAVDSLIAIMKDKDPGVLSYARESLKKIEIKNSNIMMTGIDEKDKYQ